jgi:translation initiation factor 5
MINIAGTRPIDDPAYRYQMPRLQTKIEGRGNGIKTVVVNMNEVAQALHRDPAEVTKFFGTELGAQTTYNVETAKSVVNGAHQVGDMQNHLSRYIEAFVLCSACRLPETQYKMKSDTIYQKCAACGAKEPVDMSHKLVTFITNSYKKAKKEKEREKGSSSDKKSKKDKKSKSGESKEETKERKSKKKKDGEKKSKKKRGSEEGSDNGENKEEVGEEDGLEDEEDDELAEDMDELEIDDRSALGTYLDTLLHSSVCVCVCVACSSRR